MYAVRSYEMGEETLHHYNNIKQTLLTELDDGTIVDAKSAMVAVLRLQQVVCGYLPVGEGEPHAIISNERIDILRDIVEQIEGKVIVWARFIEDGRRIVEVLTKDYGKEAVALYRGNQTAKDAAKRAFIGKSFVKFFVANPQSGGTGLDGLQKVCQHAVYYSNSFRALDRWQSEDRIDRMGMIGAASYTDIVAAKSVDRGILRNLRAKKSMSDLTLDQIRQSISQE
jgi:hypothetical protein